ncbi:MAG TPA: peptidoglycan DD-metalloendopeptidase family protein [Xanthomonadaceae bacterium]|nr:peptidoglycan DD-metalloendopeptidase family protein [Xanthomonadaceae bacterium]
MLSACVAGIAAAQDSRDAQRRLEQARKELKDVAAERRRIEGERGEASRALRAVDERLGKSSRALRETEAELARREDALADLQQRRDAAAASMAAQRRELAQLLRDAYTLGGAAPLKLLLAQDQVADANRLLAYHRYLQRARTARIAALTAQLREFAELETRLAQEREQLAQAHARQQRELSQLKRDRGTHAKDVAQLERRYRDRASREQALGRDVKGLERLLARLRAAAARAEAERRAAAERAARAARAGGKAHGKPPAVASAKPIAVGGLGWPLSGQLLAGYGGTLPDGRRSTGMLIAAPAGSTVHAVADGKVVFADWMNGYGLILIVDHGNGTMSLYAHNEALLRDAGDGVRRGDAVASVGNSGGQGRPGLYFELRRNGEPVDPVTWLRKRQ